MKKLSKLFVMLLVAVSVVTSCNKPVDTTNYVRDWGVISDYESQISFSVNSDEAGQLKVVETKVGIKESNVGDRVILVYEVLTEENALGITEINLVAMGLVPLEPIETTAELEDATPDDIQAYLDGLGEDGIDLSSVTIGGGFLNVQYTCFSKNTTTPDTNDKMTIVYIDQESTDDTKVFQICYSQIGDPEHIINGLGSYVGVTEFFDAVDKDYTVEVRFKDLQFQDNKTAKFKYNPMSAENI